MSIEWFYLKNSENWKTCDMSFNCGTYMYMAISSNDVHVHVWKLPEVQNKLFLWKLIKSGKTSLV